MADQPDLQNSALSEVYLDLNYHIKPFLGIKPEDTEHDDVLNRLNEQSAARLNSLLNVSTLAKHTVTDERFDGNTSRVHCKDFPVLSVTSITVGSTNIPWSQTADYLIEGRNTVLVDGVLAGGTGYEQNKITYVAGYVTFHQNEDGGDQEDTAITFPDELLHANLILLGGMYNQRNNEGVRSYTIQGKTVSFRDTKESADFESILNKYKKVNVWSA